MSALPQYGRHLHAREQMRAVVIDRYGTADVLRPTSVPRPVPTRGQVLVRTRFVGVNPKDVIHVIRHRHGPPKQGSDPNIARIYCVAIANQIVATYFTERTRTYENGTSQMAFNPSFGNAEATMEALDAVFGDAFFYRELALPLAERSVSFEQLLRDEAQAAFRGWSSRDDRTHY